MISLNGITKENSLYFENVELTIEEDIVLLRHNLNGDYIKGYEYNHFNLIENSLYTNIYK